MLSPFLAISTSRLLLPFRCVCVCAWLCVWEAGGYFDSVICAISLSQVVCSLCSVCAWHPSISRPSLTKGDKIPRNYRKNLQDSSSLPPPGNRYQRIKCIILQQQNAAKDSEVKRLRAGQRPREITVLTVSTANNTRSVPVRVLPLCWWLYFLAPRSVLAQQQTLRKQTNGKHSN